MLFAAIRARLHLLARSERGMALPVALFATVSSLALAGAAVISTVDVQHGSKRDNGSKSAIGAADAGANVAMMRLNRHAAQLTSEKPCFKLNATTGALEPGPAPVSEPGWCAPIEGEVGGATYSYRTSAYGTGLGVIHVVSTGTANEVTRRIQLSLTESNLWTGVPKEQLLITEAELIKEEGGSAVTLQKIEEKIKTTQEELKKGGSIAGLVGRESITASGNSDIHVGVATNGNLTTSGNTTICGGIQVGIGKKWTHSGNASQCSGYSLTEGNMELPAVSSFMPSNIATKNSNARITACSQGLPLECQKDTYNGTWSKTDPFNPSNRSISLSGNTILTLGGGDYWVCSIQLSGNSKLIMAKGAHVRFFFDTPEHCGTSNQISMSGNNEITATGYQPSLGQFDVPGFYLLGSTAYTSQVSLSGNSSTTDEFVIYGPDSYINVSGNATFKGIVAGKQIAWSGNGKIEQDKGFVIPPEITSHSGIEALLKTYEGEKLTKTKEIENLKTKIKVLKEQINGIEAGRTFNASAYVECSSTPTATLAQQPSAGC
jgi:hypothetical protein